MKKLKFKILTVILCLSSVLGYGQVRDFTATDCDGVTHNLYSELAAGNAVILNVCAGWCEPCRLADPKLEEVYQDVCQNTANVKVYGVLYDDYNYSTTDCTFGDQYASDYNLNFPLFTGSEAEYIEEIYTYEFGVNSVPAFYVIIPDTANPYQSHVEIHVGNYPNLRDILIDMLVSNGFPVQDPVSLDISGDFCDPNPYAVLSSNKTYGNIWSTGDTTQSITVTTPGIYSLEAYDDCGFLKYKEVNVEFLDSPIAGLATISDTITCSGEPYTINYSGGNSSEATWQFQLNKDGEWHDLGPADLGSYTFGLSINQQYVDFRVKAINGSESSPGCIEFSNMVSVSLPPSSGTATISKTSVCPGESLELEYNSSIDNGQVWFFNDGTGWHPAAPANIGVINFITDETDEGKVYQFKVFENDNASGCSSYSNILTLEVLQRTGNIIGSECLQIGESAKLELFDYDPSSPILWYPGGETTPTINVSPLENTDYTVEFTDLNGCANTITHHIGIPKLGTLSTPQSYACYGSYLTIVYSGGGGEVTLFRSASFFETYLEVPSTNLSDFEHDFFVGVDDTFKAFARVTDCYGNYYYTDTLKVGVRTIELGELSDIRNCLFVGDSVTIGLLDNTTNLFGFEWSPNGETTPTITVESFDEPTSYSLTYSDSFCTDYRNFFINPVYKDSITLDPQKVCDGNVFTLEYNNLNTLLYEGLSRSYPEWQYQFPSQTSWSTLDNALIESSISLIAYNSYDSLKFRVFNSSPYCDQDFSSNEVQLYVSDEHPTVSITSVPSNNVFTGGDPNTLYLGYGPQSTTLSTTVSGGNSYTYDWTGTNLSCYNCANPVFSPTTEGLYTLEVVVANESGCETSESITICVLDIRDSNNAGKILMCVSNGNNASSKSVDLNGIQAFFNNNPNAQLGYCGQSCNRTASKTGITNIDVVEELNLLVYPNPTSGTVVLSSNAFTKGASTLVLRDITGKEVMVIERSASQGSNQHEIDMSDFSSGVYMLTLKQEGTLIHIKVIKE